MVLSGPSHRGWRDGFAADARRTECPDPGRESRSSAPTRVLATGDHRAASARSALGSFEADGRLRASGRRGLAYLPHVLIVFSDRPVDQVEMLARPVDRRLEAVLEAHLRQEAELASSLLRAPEAFAGAVPVARRPDRPARPRLPVSVVDALCQLEDRRLLAARQVVGLAGRARRRAENQAADDVARRR